MGPFGLLPDLYHSDPEGQGRRPQRAFGGLRAAACSAPTGDSCLVTIGLVVAFLGLGVIMVKFTTSGPEIPTTELQQPGPSTETPAESGGTETPRSPRGPKAAACRRNIRSAALSTPSDTADTPDAGRPDQPTHNLRTSLV